jgi:hypothetical protein
MKVALGKAVWRKSSYSGQTGSCVEVADTLSGAVAVRDSTDPDGPALILASAAWRVLADRVKGSEFA